MSPKRSKETTVTRPARARAAEVQTPAALPGWLVPAVYALVCIVLFREFVLGPDRILGSDTLALSYFARNFYTEFIQRFHSFPLWDPLLFGGLPFVDGMHGDIFYPPSLALFFMNAAEAWGWKMVLHVFLAGSFTYLWLRELGLRRETALFGGLVYMMGADLVSLVLPGGDGKLFVSALAPLAFLLTERAAARRRLQDYALLSLGIALIVLTSHMQLAYFAIWGVTLYFLFRMFEWWRAERRVAPVLTHITAFGLAGLLSVAAAAVQFFPPLGYLRTYSHRAEKTVEASDSLAYSFATTYSLHPEEIVALAVPEFVGDNAATEVISGDRYWGRNPFKINHEYAGFIPLFLLPLLFFRQRRARTWFFVGLGVLALLYALGANTPFFRLFYLIPGVSLFRAPSILIFLYGLSLATLGALALERAVEWAQDGAEQGRARKYLWIAVGVTALFAVLASTGALLEFWRAVVYRGMDPDKAAALGANTQYISRGFGITFLLALAVAVIWEGQARGFYGPRTAIALLCALAFLDLYRVDRRFIRSTALMNDPNDALFFVDDATRFLQERQRAEVFRVLDIGWLLDRSHANTLGVHGLEQVVGHHGNEIGRYRELVGGDKMANLGNSEFRLLDVTNTKYVTSPGPLNMPGLTEVYRDARTIVYHRPAALPRAYLVGRTEVVPDSLAVARLLGPGFDYRTTGILGEPLPAGVSIQPDPQGTVHWVQRGANAFSLRVQTD
ncbi:MAG TPA: hypothetical protein VK864_20570, partial [Longimicrobiales bacterium]|nr:hypothetical protein [Longimicrobiales bacterium]